CHRRASPTDSSRRRSRGSPSTAGPVGWAAMQIVSALFIDDMAMRQVPGPSTRIDLTGIQFSAPAPGPFPVTVTPHMVVLIRNEPHGAPNGALEVVFRLDGE